MVYRLYSEDREFLKEIEAESYVEAKELLQPIESGSIFVVEDDGHEVKCGIEWVRDLLDADES